MPASLQSWRFFLWKVNLDGESLSLALRMISNRSDICVSFDGVGHEREISVWCGEERERAGKKTRPIFLQNTFNRSKRWGTYMVQLREGRVWDGVERREWEGRGEVLAAARRPVMSDLYPWVLWLALAYCEGLHLHCRRKTGRWVWNKQDNMVSWLQIYMTEVELLMILTASFKRHSEIALTQIPMKWKWH